MRLALCRPGEHTIKLDRNELSGELIYCEVRARLVCKACGKREIEIWSA